MKISSENSIRHYENTQAYKSKTSSKEMGAASVKTNRDQVIIGSSTPQIEEKKIAEELAHNVIQDVRKVTSEERIEQLKQQVADGTYRPDADKIASKILLEKGFV